MKPVTKILCVIDPIADVQTARDRAALLARAFNAELRLYVSYYNAYLPDVTIRTSTAAPSLSREAIEVLQRNIDEMAVELRGQGLAVTTHAEWRASLYDSIIEEVVSFGANLVVKDTHYHTAISRAMFTNTDWNLIRKCPVPLWLVKPGVCYEEEPPLLACVDPLLEHDKPTSLDDEILTAGAMLSDVLGGPLYAFHAFNPLVEIGNTAKWAVKPARLPVEALSEQMRKEHSKAFFDLTERHGIDAPYRVLKSGSVATMLPSTITELGASLAIMGAVTRRKFRHMLIGSTAEKVMDHIACDLLVVKPG